MGISGLLPLLKEIQVTRNISDFRGKRLAIDAYVWLHKGAFGCAEDIVKGKRTTKFVDYAMYRVRMLQHHGITPYVVFDGGPLPAKRGTEDSRAKSRADYMARAQAFELQGRHKDARDCYTKCLDITPEMAYQLIKALRAENVEYVVAPYEADAQLCYLERQGIVDGIITEDSDLLVFGCTTVIFKLEKDGSCVSIDSNRLGTVRQLPMHGWTPLQFRRMAMLSGCDYLPSIPGIGLKKAHSMLRRHRTVEKLLQSLRLEGAHAIPSTYAADFSKAELAFLYQRVFDPQTRTIVTLSALPDEGLSEEEEKWVGLHIDIETARGMADGDLHPETRDPIEDLWPNFRPSPRKREPGGDGAGTLDAFVTRVKRTRSTPVPVARPPRIGEIGNGPARLSDIHIPLRREATEPAPISPRPAVVKASKFFSKKPAAVDEEAFDLMWERSSAAATKRQRSATPEDVRSPTPELRHSLSPLASIAHPTPSHVPLDDEGDGGHFTSPVSVRSGFTTPPRSTPRKVLVDDSQPLGKPEPSSPSPTPRVLIAASSQMMTHGIPPLSQRSQASDDTEVYDDDDATPRYAPAPRFQRITSVLVPASSPGLRDVVAASSSPSLRSAPVNRARAAERTSSDSAADDDIVTPSPTRASKRRRPAEHDKENAEDEEDEEDRARADRTRTIAEGWRQKYALSAAFSSPARSSPGAGEFTKKPTPTLHKYTSAPAVPISAARNVLAARSANVPNPKRQRRSRSPETKAKPTSPVSKPKPRLTLPPGHRRASRPVPDAAHPEPAPRPRPHCSTAAVPAEPKRTAANPHGLSWSALERFRFSRT